MVSSAWSTTQTGVLKTLSEDFPDSPVAVRTPTLPLQRAWVRSLVGELRSRMLHGVAKNKTKQTKQNKKTLSGPLRSQLL